MAKMVFAAGVSHRPMLTLDPAEWVYRSKADLGNPRLNTSGWALAQLPAARIGGRDEAFRRSNLRCLQTEGRRGPSGARPSS
jgi:hypothetical protein